MLVQLLVILRIQELLTNQCFSLESNTKNEFLMMHRLDRQIE